MANRSYSQRRWWPGEVTGKTCKHDNRCNCETIRREREEQERAWRDGLFGKPDTPEGFYVMERFGG